MRRFPVFFSQRKSDGMVESVFLSAREKKALARFKAGLVHSLVRRVHKSAIAGEGQQQQQQPQKKGDMSYVFQASDASGPYVAENNLQHDASGNMVLVESSHFEHTGTFADTKSNTAGVKQNRNCTAKFTADGHLQELSSVETLSIGGANYRQKDGSSPALLGRVPGVGKLSFRVAFDAHFVESSVIELAAQPKTDAEVQSDLDRMLGGIVAVPLRETVPTATTTPASSFLDLEDEEGDSADMAAAAASMQDPAQALLAAEELLSRSSKTVAGAAPAKPLSVRDLLPLVRSGGARTLVNHARSLFHDGALDVNGFKAVLGALTARRTPESYDALLSALRDTSLPNDVRRQAVVSLLHTDTEGPAPDYVVRGVADLAFQRSISSQLVAPLPMSHESTLLLGALLSGRPEEDTEMRLYLSKLQDELKTLDATNPAEADRAVAVLGALGNSEAPGAASSVLRFLDSQSSRVRVAAVDALRSLRAADKRRSQAAAAAAAVNASTRSVATALVQEDEEDDVLAELDLDGTSTTNSASSTTSSADDDEEEDLAESRGDFFSFLDVGSGQSRQLLDRTVSITDSADVAMKMSARSGVKWVKTKVGGFGSAAVSARIMDFSKDIVSTGFNGHVEPHAGVGCNGNVNMYLNIAGKRVLNTERAFAPTDLFTGGQCPVSALDARLSPPTTAAANKQQQQQQHVFSRELLHFRRRFMLGPVPIKMDMSVAGSLGSRLLFSGFLNCQSPKSLADIALVSGVSPIMDLYLETSASADAYVAAAGVVSTVALSRGELPSYTVATTSSACSSVDVVSPPCPASVSIFAKAMQKSWTKPLVDQTRAAEHKQGVLSQCAALPLGDFIAGRDLKRDAEAAAAAAHAAATAAAATRAAEGVIAQQQHNQEEEQVAPMMGFHDPQHHEEEENLVDEDSDDMVMLQGTMGEAAVQIALSQVGVCEATGRNDGIPAQRYANGRREPWCGDFVAWVYHQAGQQLPGNPKWLSGVQYMEDKLKAAGLYHTGTPAAGDIIFFSNPDAGSDVTDGRHAGVVVGVDAGNVHTIEGNAGNCVRQRSYPLNSPRIAGYARPTGAIRRQVTTVAPVTTNSLQEGGFVSAATTAANQVLQAQQAAARAAAQASNMLNRANYNVGAIKSAFKTVARASAQGVDAARQARTIAQQVFGQERVIQKDEGNWVGTPQESGRASLSGELRDKLDSTVNTVGSVASTVEDSSERTRDVVSNEGASDRAATRTDAEASRSTARQGARQVESSVQTNSAEMRSEVREESQRSRETVRNNERRVTGDVDSTAGSDRRAIRRDGEREEAGEQSTRNTERRGVGELEKEMSELQKSEQDKRMRDMFRRQMSEVKAKDSSVENLIRREDDRNRLKRVENDEDKRMKSIKNNVRRDEQKKSEERDIDRLEADTQRRFGREDQKSRFNKIGREVNRAEDTKGFERRQINSVKSVMRREETQNKQSQRLTRFEKSVERKADETKTIEADVRHVESTVQEEGQDNRRQARREQSTIESQVQREDTQKDEATQAEQTRDLLRREDTQRTDERQTQQIENQEATQSQETRDTERRDASSVEQNQQQQQQQSEQQQQFAEVREQGREEASEERSEAREVSSNVGAEIAAGQAQQEQSQEMQGVEQADAGAAQAAQQDAAKVEGEVAQQGAEANAEQKQEGQQAERAQAREGRKERRNARRTEKTVSGDLNKQAQNSKAFAERQGVRMRREQRHVAKSIGKINQNKKSFEGHVQRRMERSSERNQMEKQEEQDAFSKRTSRMDAKVESSEKASENHLTRELARRAERTNSRLAAVAKSASKRVSRLEARTDSRFARKAGRDKAERQASRQHLQRRFARDDARDSARQQRLRGHESNREGRTESREAGGEAALAQKFGLRMGDAQKAFSALAGK